MRDLPPSLTSITPAIHTHIHTHILLCMVIATTPPTPAPAPPILLTLSPSPFSHLGVTDVGDQRRDHECSKASVHERHTRVTLELQSCCTNNVIQCERHTLNLLRQTKCVAVCVTVCVTVYVTVCMHYADLQPHACTLAHAHTRAHTHTSMGLPDPARRTPTNCPLLS
jgi:hypothetical protein